MKCKFSEGMELTALIYTVMSDEASTRLRLRDYTGGDVSSARSRRALCQTVKIQQSLVQVGVLVKCKETKRYRFIFCELPVPLQVVDRTTAETMVEAHRDLVAALGIGSTVKPEMFKHCYAITTMDKSGGNERMLHELHHHDPIPGCRRLRFHCDIHRMNTVETRTWESVNSHVSGILALAIGQRGTAKLASFRDSLAEVLKSRLDIVHNPVHLSGDAADYRNAVMDLCLPRCVMDTRDGDGKGERWGWNEDEDGAFLQRGVSSRMRHRTTLETYLQSDLRQRRIKFYARGRSDEEARADFLEHVPCALVPAMLPIFPRHRWVGSERALREGTLLCLVHDLFTDIVADWSTQNGVAKVVAPVPALVSQPREDGLTVRPPMQRPTIVMRLLRCSIRLFSDFPRIRWCTRVGRVGFADAG